MTKREPKLVYFCPFCHKIFRTETAVCPNCNGAIITQDVSQCPSCRQWLPEGALTCPSCNRPVINSLTEEALHYTSRQPRISYEDSLKIPPSDEYHDEHLDNPSAIWYLLPFLFGLIGGLIGYVGTKDRDKGIATKLLVFGILWNLIWVAISWWIWVTALYH